MSDSERQHQERRSFRDRRSCRIIRFPERCPNCELIRCRVKDILRLAMEIWALVKKRG